MHEASGAKERNDDARNIRRKGVRNDDARGIWREGAHDEARSIWRDGAP